MEYTIAMLAFSVVGMLSLYLIQRLQYFLPLNPQGFAGVSPDWRFNTAELRPIPTGRLTRVNPP